MTSLRNTDYPQLTFSFFLIIKALDVFNRKIVEIQISKNEENKKGIKLTNQQCVNTTSKFGYLFLDLSCAHICTILSFTKMGSILRFRYLATRWCLGSWSQGPHQKVFAEGLFFCLAWQIASCPLISIPPISLIIRHIFSGNKTTSLNLLAQGVTT